MIRRGWFVLALLTLSSIGHGANPVEHRRLVMPYGGTHFLQSFDPKQKAKILAIGEGERASGLYIFDSDGNCVSWDDTMHREVQDDLAVEFTPTSSRNYAIEVRNMGPVANNFTVTVK